ncbi:hypothetical protein NSED_01025 [Candidatus Nitrosopumilus sediminis]|uniref:Uncharacterized protein n=1 Tax=Candidatus Nitrosopumilus sediminis TaxID=1229909 RepID=K0BAA3_9ARCH|nr:hypothetical protein NSED_01025 [Candidatus Nitrosopumilus sediminis]
MRKAFNKLTNKLIIVGTINTLFLFSVLVLGMVSYPGSNLISIDDDGPNTSFLIAFADSHDEDVEDELEEEIEIEVEVEDGFAKIKVEINDEESKFEIEWIDEQTTIDEIVTLTGLTEDQVSSVITFEIESEEDDEENESKQSKKDEKLTKAQEKRDEKLTKAQEKRDEKQARNAEKFAEREAKLAEKAQFSEQRANKIIEDLEQKIQKMEKRLQKLLEKYESGEYFGNLKNKDTVTKSFTLSFDGGASEIGNSLNTQTLNGQLFLENQVTGDKAKKFRVTGGEISIGEEDIYDIVFGKARLSSSGSGGDKDSMVVIAQVSNTGEIRTLKLNINLSEEFNSDTESADIEILSPQSKIASQWFLSGIGDLGLTESEETGTSESGNIEDDTNNDSEIDIPTDDIPIITTLTVSTPTNVYFSGDDIIISGTVLDIHEGTPVILQTVTDSDRVDIAQIDVNSDGTFTHTILADGSLWVSGTYTIKAFYGANNFAETTFEFIASS